VSLALVLNFDADLELERGAGYQPTHSVRERARTLALAMRSALPARVVVIDPLGERPPPDARAIAWCPTPRALRAIDAVGLARPRVPDLAVLARVNARPFAFALGSGELPGSVLAEDVDTALAAIAQPGAWRLKRIHGVSGRGQRSVHGGAATDNDLAFVRASIARHGALVIEPRVAIERELSVHAWRTSGATHVRSIREQVIDAHGAFVSSTAARDLAPAIERTLVDAAERVGDALGAAGYLGPFGVDAFVHSRGALRTLSEINARYCMGWDETDGWEPPAAA
jgi:hypothetical protein